MAGELVDIPDQLSPAFCRSGAAHAPAHRNFDTGRLALEGTQYQCIVFQQVKTRPAETAQGVVEQSCGVGQIGNTVGYAVNQRRKMGVQRLIVRHFSTPPKIRSAFLCRMFSRSASEMGSW